MFINIFWIKRNRLKGGCFHTTEAIACGCLQLSIYQVTGSDTILIDFFTGGKCNLVEISLFRNCVCCSRKIRCITNLNALTRCKLDSIAKLHGELAAVNGNILVQIILPSLSAVQTVAVHWVVLGIDCTDCILHSASQFVFQNDVSHVLVFVTGFLVGNGGCPHRQTRERTICTNCCEFAISILRQTRSGLFKNLLQGQVCGIGCNLARLVINQNFLFTGNRCGILQRNRNCVFSIFICTLLLQHRCNFSCLGISQFCGVYNLQVRWVTFLINF